MHDDKGMKESGLKLSRRSFLAWSGIVGAGAALSGCAPKAEKESSQQSGIIGAEPFAYETRPSGEAATSTAAAAVR